MLMNYIDPVPSEDELLPGISPASTAIAIISDSDTLKNFKIIQRFLLKNK